jgi:hypothetical protein
VLTIPFRYIHEDITVHDINALRNPRLVQEMFDLKITPADDALKIARRDLEEVSVPKEDLPELVRPDGKRGVGRPRGSTNAKKDLPTGPPQPKRPVGRPKGSTKKIDQLLVALALYGENRSLQSKESKCCSSRPLTRAQIDKEEIDRGRETDFSEGWGEQKQSSADESKGPFGLQDGEEVLELHWCFVSNEFTERDEPWLFSDENPDSQGWLESNSLEKLKVLTQDTMQMLDPKLPLPPGTKPLPIILIYCRKRADAFGNRRYKCRAVVLGNLQKENLLPSFAPVISIPGVRLLLTEAVANAKNGEVGITLFDISTAFLNAPLEDSDGKIIVKIPQSWIDERGARYALLKRALYGLRISPKRWFVTIHKFLVENGWIECANCLYYKTLPCGTVLWLCLYVDDVIMGGGSVALRNVETELIFAKFPGTMIEPKISSDGTHLYDVNGIEVEINWTTNSYLMHMDKYIAKVCLAHRVARDEKTVHPRINPDLVMQQDTKSDFPVRTALGCLIWLSVTTRPDITYDVNILARFVGSFGATQGTASGCKKILKYLDGTRRRGLRYSPEREKAFQKRYSVLIEEQCDSVKYGSCDRTPQEFSRRVFVFSDASFASCPLSLRSQTGSCVYFRGALIAYKTNKQTIITHSTCASEYVAASDTVQFVEQIEPHLRLFDPVEVGVSQLDIPVFVDNESAIRIARSDVLGNASKHLKLRFIRVSEQQKKLFFVGTKDQQADAFTKSLGESIFGMMCLIENDGDLWYRS